MQSNNGERERERERESKDGEEKLNGLKSQTWKTEN